jgi:hypothetical protein
MVLVVAHVVVTVGGARKRLVSRAGRLRLYAKLHTPADTGVRLFILHVLLDVRDDMPAGDVLCDSLPNWRLPCPSRIGIVLGPPGSVTSGVASRSF